jgi:GT2 family glycosyltransferase
VYIVNNSPDEHSARMLAFAEERDDVVVLDQAGNVGVATGFNAGIRAALAAGFDDVWIFDQDSRVTPGSLHRLLEARVAREASGEAVGVVGPAALQCHGHYLRTGVRHWRPCGRGADQFGVAVLARTPGRDRAA